MTKYDLTCEFDIELHKQTFVHYLEICIDEEGKCHYAVPSHQEFMIKYACEKLNITREELSEKCPIEYYCDFLTWLQQITGLIPVWTEFYRGNPNKKQMKTIDQLIKAGLLEE